MKITKKGYKDKHKIVTKIQNKKREKKNSETKKEFGKNRYQNIIKDDKMKKYKKS